MSYEYIQLYLFYQYRDIQIFYSSEKELKKDTLISNRKENTYLLHALTIIQKHNWTLLADYERGNIKNI